MWRCVMLLHQYKYMYIYCHTLLNKRSWKYYYCTNSTGSERQLLSLLLVVHVYMTPLQLFQRTLCCNNIWTNYSNVGMFSYVVAHLNQLLNNYFKYGLGIATIYEITPTFEIIIQHAIATTYEIKWESGRLWFMAYVFFSNIPLHPWHLLVNP